MFSKPNPSRGTVPLNLDKFVKERGRQLSTAYTVLPVKISCLKEDIKEVFTRTKLILLQESSSACYFSRVVYYFSEFNRLCPGANTLYVFVATDLPWRWKSQRSKIHRLAYRFYIDFSLLGPAYSFLSQSLQSQTFDKNLILLVCSRFLKVGQAGLDFHQDY
jgi:hypothetical protein